MKCPVCGNDTFDDKNFAYNICPECFWEYDEITLDEPDLTGGANQISFNNYKKMYADLKKENPAFSCRHGEDLKLLKSTISELYEQVREQKEKEANRECAAFCENGEKAVFSYCQWCEYYQGK